MPRSRRSAVDSDGSDRRQRAGWNLLNGTIDVNHPQALTYEPSPNGKMELVGVEFITFASAWRRTTPVLQFRKARCSCTSTAQTGSTYRPSSSFTCGRGGTPAGRFRRLERPCDLRT